MSKPVTVELTSDEALVLFEWLARFDDQQEGSSVDPAEQRVLWKLEATLESNLTVLREPDYEARLAAAKLRLRDRDEA